MDGRPRPAGALVLLAVVLGCAGGGSDDDGRRSGAGRCRPPAQGPTISLATNVQPIFDRSCALGGCHAGAVPAGGLTLAAGQSRAATVGVPATVGQGRIRIVAGDADASYLVHKIEGGPDIFGELMPQGCPGNPQNGAVCLVGDSVASIRTWIDECALDN